MYKVLVSESAAEFIHGQNKKIQRQLHKKMKNLESDPYPSNCVKLSGGDDLYRIRSGDYRIIYTVKNNKITVLVLKIGYRKDVYKGLF